MIEYPDRPWDWLKLAEVAALLPCGASIPNASPGPRLRTRRRSDGWQSRVRRIRPRHGLAATRFPV